MHIKLESHRFSPEDVESDDDDNDKDEIIKVQISDVDAQPKPMPIWTVMMAAHVVWGFGLGEEADDWQHFRRNIICVLPFAFSCSDSAQLFCVHYAAYSSQTVSALIALNSRVMM